MKSKITWVISGLFILIASALFMSLDAEAAEGKNITAGETKTIFFTEPGSTDYSAFSGGSGDYIISAASTSGKISIVIAQQDGTVINIEDDAVKTTADGKNLYVTSRHQTFDSGSYKIGVSAQRVTTIRLTVKKMPELVENEKQSTSLAPEEIMAGYAFMPKCDGGHIFFMGDKRYGLSAKLYDSDGEVLDSTSSGRYMSDYGLFLYTLSYDLKQGQRYYVVADGAPGYDDCVNEMTVVRKLSEDVSTYSLGKTAEGKISYYFDRNVYRVSIKNKASYYFSVSSADGDMGMWLYDSSFSRIKKAEYTSYNNDSYGNYSRKTETSIDLSPGEYYVVLRMNDYGKGKFTFKCNEVPAVKRIAVTHKPSMKTLIYGVDEKFDLSGIVLTIYYKDGSNAKWTYDSGNLVKNAFPVEISYSVKKKTAVATIKYRGKKTTVSCDVKKVNQVYSEASSLTLSGSKRASMDSNGTRFYKFTPQKSGVYSINLQRKGKGFWCAVFDPNGERLSAQDASYSWKNRSAWYTAKPAAYMIAGKTYYVGMKNWGGSVKNRITVKVHDDTPGTPSGISVKKVSGTSVEISWKKVSGADGYQIKYYPAGDSKKAVKITTNYNTENYIDELKKGKSYTFVVRAYRKLNGKRYYGSWSTTFR